jgi:hypothetical protein
MKKLLISVLVLMSVSFGQFKDNNVLQPSIKEALTSPASNSMMFGFIDPANFSMNHSVSLSYASFGSNSFSLSTYTNSMMYKFSDKLDVQVDASLVASPYSSLGRNFQNQISGLYLSRAELNYKPWENCNISLQYRSLPGGYSPFYNNFYGF